MLKIIKVKGGWKIKNTTKRKVYKTVYKTKDSAVVKARVIREWSKKW